MSKQDYERNRAHLRRIDEKQEGIYLTTLHPSEARTVAFWTKWALPTFKTIWSVAEGSALIHAGPSTNVYQPIEIFALISAVLKGRKTIAVVDIDIRKDTFRAMQLKQISRSRYALDRFIIDPLRRLQFAWIARRCSLVLFKGQALVDDYGNGRQSVKNFFDASHSESNVISLESLTDKARRINSTENPVKAIYFGRLVKRKGVDLCVRAVVHARSILGSNITLTIMGDGPEKQALVDLVDELGAQDFVSFQLPMAFGQVFFDEISKYDLLLAAPLMEDTPRSAFDAMASGMAICAFDTDYYRTLAGLGPIVFTSPWMQMEQMAQTMSRLTNTRAELIAAQALARTIAEKNTQEIWLETRLKWTKEFCELN